MTGKENVLIKKKTIKIIIVLVLLDIFLQNLFSSTGHSQQAANFSF